MVDGTGAWQSQHCNSIIFTRRYLQLNQGKSGNDRCTMEHSTTPRRPANPSWSHLFPYPRTKGLLFVTRILIVCTPLMFLSCSLMSALSREICYPIPAALHSCQCILLRAHRSTLHRLDFTTGKRVDRGELPKTSKADSLGQRTRAVEWEYVGSHKSQH